MDNLKWSESEKKLSRRVFEAALAAELSETMSEFKSMAAAAATPQAMWALEEYLARKRHDMDSKYDYRYSQLLLVFGRLVREGRVTQEQLSGLAPEKLAFILRMQEL